MKTLVALLLLSGVAYADDYTGWPPGTIPINVNSGIVANTEIVLTLTAEPHWINYLVGAGCSSNGATAGSWQTATLEGLIGGTRYTVFYVNEIAPTGNKPTTATAGVSASIYPEPAFADGVDIVFTLPALGAGNTMTACSMTGFKARDPKYPN